MAKKQLRQIRVDGNVAYVPLTKGYEAIIDADDVHLVAGKNWCASVYSHTVYAVTRSRVNGKITTARMHRVLMGECGAAVVDHKDGDGLNNRRSVNLRLASAVENARNQKISSNNSSGLKGVSWHNSSQKWQARISVKKKQVSIGFYTSPLLAYEAYCEASKEFHGEFGRTS